MTSTIVGAALTALILFVAARLFHLFHRGRHPGVAVADSALTCLMVHVIANSGSIAWTSQISVALWWLTVALCAAGTACSIFTYLLTLRSD